MLTSVVGVLLDPTHIAVMGHWDFTQNGPDGKPSLRYELPDGQRLQRKDDRFANADGTLVLTAT